MIQGYQEGAIAIVRVVQKQTMAIEEAVRERIVTRWS
jgi:hypothetical protein